MKDALSKILKNPMVWAAIIYLLFPVDFVADAVPVAGTADDLAVMLVTMLLQEYFAQRE